MKDRDPFHPMNSRGGDRAPDPGRVRPAEFVTESEGVRELVSRLRHAACLKLHHVVTHPCVVSRPARPCGPGRTPPCRDSTTGRPPRSRIRDRRDGHIHVGLPRRRVLSVRSEIRNTMLRRSGGPFDRRSPDAQRQHLPRCDQRTRRAERSKAVARRSRRDSTRAVLEDHHGGSASISRRRRTTCRNPKQISSHIRGRRAQD